MALTYTTDDFYFQINNEIQSIQGPTPLNLTLTPDYKKPDLLTPLTPYNGLSLNPPTTIPKSGLSLIEVPANMQLRGIGEGQSGAEPSLSTTSNEIAIRQRNEQFDIWRAKHGRNSKSQVDIDNDYNEYIKTAAYAEYGAAALTAIGGVADAISARNYRKDVEKTKSQYETQKKIIDTNIDNTESALLENLRENMANLDVMTAAQNVDISSQAIQGDKAKGAMDLGEDVAAMRQSGALQKAALDLEYAMNVKRARKAELNSYVGAALQIGGAALSLI